MSFRKLVWPMLVALGCGCGSADSTSPAERRAPPGTPITAVPAPTAPPSGDAGPLFGDAITTIALTLDPGAMAALAVQPRKYVHGTVEFQGLTYEDVAVRFKGHRTMRKWAGKPAFRFNFGKYDKGRRFHGLKTLILNNMVEDPTMLRESLGTQVFRKLGVPTPRSGHMELSVNGKPYGLYLALEPVDALFVAAQFGQPGGLLYEGEYGCDVYPGDVWGMELESGEDPGRRHLRALADAAGGPIAGVLADRLDANRFLHYLAVSVVIGDFDGYRHGHNYRLYRALDSGRWNFLPSGLDRVMKRRLGAFEIHGRLGQACFADPGCRLRYVQALQHTAEAFEKMGLAAELARLDARIAPAVARDPRRPHSAARRQKALDKTLAFIKERPAEIRAATTCWDGSRELDRDGDGYGCMDCDDGNAAVHPGAAQHCDGVDNNCSGLVDDGPDCACPAVDVDGEKFWLCDLPMSHAAAALSCRARGRTLATVDTRAQSKALYKLAKKRNDDQVWWIGLDDRETEGEFRWADGTPVGKPVWGKGEPDVHRCGEDCVGLRRDGSGKWRDLHCASLRPFICR